MNTKRIGNTGEAKVLYELVCLGIPVYQQFGDNEPADYIIIVNKKPLKLQVKTSTDGDEEKVSFDLDSKLTSKRSVRHHYTSDEVDYFLCYDLVNDKIFVVKNNGNIGSIIIRYKTPKNNQSARVNMAKDFLLREDLFC